MLFHGNPSSYAYRAQLTPGSLPPIDQNQTWTGKC